MSFYRIFNVVCQSSEQIGWKAINKKRLKSSLEQMLDNAYLTAVQWNNEINENEMKQNQFILIFHIFDGRDGPKVDLCNLNKGNHVKLWLKWN